MAAASPSLDGRNAWTGNATPPRALCLKRRGGGQAASRGAPVTTAAFPPENKEEAPAMDPRGDETAKMRSLLQAKLKSDLDLTVPLKDIVPGKQVSD